MRWEVPPHHKKDKNSIVNSVISIFYTLAKKENNITRIGYMYMHNKNRALERWKWYRIVLYGVHFWRIKELFYIFFILIYILWFSFFPLLFIFFLLSYNPYEKKTKTTNDIKDKFMELRHNHKMWCSPCIMLYVYLNLNCFSLF